jgi:hypothetical protein
MRANGTDERPRRVVRNYGRGSYLGFLSPLLAYLMAARGMRGWQASTIAAMEQDIIEMGRIGYRVVDTREAALPGLGIQSWTVTFELEPSA